MVSFKHFWSRDELVVDMEWSPLMIIKIPYAGDKCLTVKPEWFSAYINRKLGKAFVCNIPREDKHIHVCLLFEASVELP